MSRFSWLRSSRRAGRRKMVAVLGCGPAGLFAAHALALAEVPFVVFSKKRLSEMFGAQYLHENIPGLSGGAFWINYTLIGTIEDYARKVYGPQFDPERSSPARLLGEHPAWDIREAYYKAWDLYEDRIDHRPDLDVTQIVDIAEEFGGRVISSIPATALCSNPAHRFVAQEVWAMGDAPERGIRIPIRPAADNLVVCNGQDSPGWYRSASVQGYATAEWPFSPKPPIEGVVSVRKPISTNCDCLPGILRVGRYGTWDKKVLSHLAYYNVAKEF